MGRADAFVPPGDRPFPLAFLKDARDLRRHAFAALNQTGAHETSLETHPDPIGLRAVLAAGLAMSVLPRVSIVAPLVDVGARWNLPPSVRVWSLSVPPTTASVRLARALMAALHRT